MRSVLIGFTLVAGTALAVALSCHNSSDSNKLSSSDPVIPVQELAVHNTATDCWIQINQGVYDVSSCLQGYAHHATYVAPYCGKDASAAWASVPAHVVALLNGRKVGHIQTSSSSNASVVPPNSVVIILPTPEATAAPTSVPPSTPIPTSAPQPTSTPVPSTPPPTPPPAPTPTPVVVPTIAPAPTIAPPPTVMPVPTPFPAPTFVPAPPVSP